MKKLFSFANKHWPFTIVTLILIGLIIIYGITNNFIQIFHYDMVEQYVRFIERGYDLIRTPGFEWWDYNHFLGSSIFAYGYYFLFSPFWLIFASLPSKDMILRAMLFVNTLKLWVLFVTSYYYFNHISKDKLAQFAGASIITFGAFTLGYYQYGFYTDALVFLPIVLVGVEKYLKEDKWLHLVLSTTVLAIVNIYLFIMFTAFIFLYTLFRYFILQSEFYWKVMFYKAYKFFAYYLLAITLSAVILWPNLQLLLESSRISSTVQVSHIDFNILYRFVTSWIMPVVDRNNFNPLIDKNISSAAGYSGGVAIYSLIITPLFLPQIFINFNNKVNRFILIFYAFLSIVFLFPPLYFFLQGNSDTRWMLMYILLNAFSIVYVLENREKLNKTLFYLTAFFLFGLLSVSYIYSLKSGLQLNRLYFDIAKRNIIVLFVLILLYSVGIYFKNKKISDVVLVSTICIEIILVLFNIFFNPIDSISMNTKQYSEDCIHDTNVIETIQDLDNSPYRIEVIQSSGYNDPLSKDYMGLTFYSSVYNFEVDEFIQNNISSAGGWLVGNNTGKAILKNLMGVKYWAVDMDKPFYIPYGYEPLKTVEQEDQTYILYENKYAAPLVYTQTDTLNIDTWLSLSSLDKSRTLISYVVTENSDKNEIILNDSFTKITEFGTEFYYDMPSPLVEQIVYVEFPRSEEVRIQVYGEGKLIKDFYSYEPNWASVYLEEYFDEIKVTVTNLWEVPEEEFINTLSIQDVSHSIKDWYADITNDPFEITLDTNQFTITGSSSKSQWLVTSIAYDDNWSIELNGEKVKSEKVNGGFIGLEIPAGEIIIEAKYVPHQVIQGGIVSLLSVLLLSYLVIKGRRQA